MTETIRTALLDADVITYQSASKAQGSFGDEVWGDINKARAYADEQIHKEMEQAGCNTVILVYSPKNSTNWRKLVMPEYKMHRKATPKPVCYGELRNALESQYKHVSIDWLEGDDLFHMLYKKIPNSVVVSIDKDMYTLPNINYLRPHTMRYPEYQSYSEANAFWLTQVLMGDSTDGYKGLKGCGPKGSDSLLNDYWFEYAPDFDFDGAWKAVKEAYRAKGQTNWLEQAQMARILRDGDYCSKTKRVRLFNPAKEEWLELPDAPTKQGELR